MVPSIESAPASSVANGDSSIAVHECDFCGRAVHRATATERGGHDPEVIILCGQCASDAD